MSEQRRATVVMIQRGDPEIAGALMAGVMAGRGNREQGTGNRDSVPEARPVESVEIVTVETDKWRRVARQVRIAVGNDKTAEDYRLMIIKARCEYATHRRTGPAHAVARKLLLAWVMLCQGIRRAYRAQDRVLRPR